MLWTNLKVFLVIALIVGMTFFVPNPFTSTTRNITITGGTYTRGLVVSSDNAIVDGVDVTNTNGGVCLKITGNNVTVRNSYIHDCKDHGVQFLGTDGGLFEHNEITRAAMRYAPNTVSSGWPSLFKVQSVDETETGVARNIVVRDNYIHEGYGECMGLRGSNILVESNFVKDCYSVGIYSNSDHTQVLRNFVLCTGNPKYNRSGYPMTGISNAEETFTKWGAHGHDTQTIVNNIVSGCKYGYRYGTSSKRNGLAHSVIAFNTFYKTKQAPISITYYASQTDDTIHNNIARKVSANPAGISIQGNVIMEFAEWSTSTDFILTAPLPAQGSYTISTDFGDRARIAPLDAGAWDYLQSSYQKGLGND